MNKLTFFFAGLLLIPFIFDEAFAQVEKGQNFDRVASGGGSFIWTSHAERILDGGEWKDFVLFEDANIIQVETGQGSFQIDKNTCSFAFWNGGKISGNPTIPNEVYLARQSTDGITFIEVTQINNAACQTTTIINGNDIEIQTIKSHAIGEMKIRYIKNEGLGLKTQMEVTNTSGLNDRYFAFFQILGVPQNINFGGNQIDLATKNNTFYDRDFIIANKNKLVSLSDKVNYDFDKAFSNLLGVKVLWNGTNAFLEFDFSHNAQILPDGETFIIDPGFNSADPTVDGYFDDVGNDICDDGSLTKVTGDVGVRVFVATVPDGNDCRRAFSEWDISSIPDLIAVSNSSIQFDIQSVSAVINCDLTLMDVQPSVGSDADVFNSIGTDTKALTNSAYCTVAGNNQDVDLGGAGDNYIEAQANDGWAAVGFKFNDETIGVQRTVVIAAEEDGTATPQLTLQINYTAISPPDAITDLTAGNVTFTTTDLNWSQPGLNGGILSGYQINFTTPHGPPLTVITNDTLSAITNFAVSGLTQASNYSFRVSAWTNNTNNATGNLANITTASFGNFTVGFIDIDATNIDFRTWKFARTDLNSSAYSLSVIYPSTYNATCSFHFKFAMLDQNFSNLPTTPSGSGELESIFIFNNTASEVIDVTCINENDSTTPEGIFLLTQSNFLLLQQFAEFRDGTYGTLGMIGSIDLITMVGIIVAMIGFNRINESVGYFFLIAILGVMAFFQIIIWPVALSGLILVIGVLTYTSTRKPG